MNLEETWGIAETYLGVAAKVAGGLLTLGGNSAIGTNWNEYRKATIEHTKSVAEYKRGRAEAESEVSVLGQETETCIRLLRNAKAFVEQLSGSSGSSGVPTMKAAAFTDMSHAAAVLNDFDLAMTASVGAGVGTAASVGAWALVTHFGAASTGAAISGLYGVAATNAALAWFGGGAVAAGGGGVLVGGLVIGVVTVIPLIALSAYKSYKKANIINRATEETIAATSENLEISRGFLRLAGKSRDLRLDFANRRAAFDQDFEQVRIEACRLAERLANAVEHFGSALQAANGSLT